MAAITTNGLSMTAPVMVMTFTSHNLKFWASTEFKWADVETQPPHGRYRASAITLPPTTHRSNQNRRGNIPFDFMTMSIWTVAASFPKVIILLASSRNMAMASGMVTCVIAASPNGARLLYPVLSRVVIMQRSPRFDFFGDWCA